MQKHLFEYLHKQVIVNASLWEAFKVILKKKGLTFSKWVRQKIEEEINNFKI